MSLLLVNRSPEPDEQDWPLNGLFEFDIVNTLYPTEVFDPTSLRVYIDGTLALSGSTFQAGWTGTGSAISTIGAYTTHVAIDQNSNLGSLQAVQIHIVAHTTVGTTLLDETYSFTAEDVSTPEVESVLALSLTTLQVTFNEPVSSAALSPGSYEIARQVAPSVAASVVSVAQVSERVYVLTTSTELTHRVAYLLTVSDVQDSSGNVIAPPFNSLVFDSFTPVTPAGRDFDLFRALPQINRDEDVSEDLKKFLACLQEVTEQLLFSIDSWTDIIDVDIAPEPFVDAMLNDLGNPFNFALSLEDKRRLARVLVSIYKQKGLAKGIKNAVRFFLGFEVGISPFVDVGMSLGESELGVDWELGTGDKRALRTFNLEVVFMLTNEQRQRLLKIARYMKPLNTHIGLLIEPLVPETFDHWELGISEIGETTILH